MAEQGSSKRLTRVDVLVAAGVCLLLIVVVMVLFAKPREAGVRRLCAANLAQIGKAMLVYAGENDGQLPRAGEPNSVWGPMSGVGWCVPARRLAFNLRVEGNATCSASISSSLYLLVKYQQVAPGVFVCKGDRGTTEFRLSRLDGVPAGLALADAWDFGPPTEAFRHCSYAYHVPYSMYALTTSRDPNLAVAADRNPWIRSPASLAGKWATFKPDEPYPGGTPGAAEQGRLGNSIAHRQDGQNVLFLDGRVAFEKRAFCGADRDNIYTISRNSPVGSGDPYGVLPAIHPTCSPMNDRDSLLVHDPCSLPHTDRRR